MQKLLQTLFLSSMAVASFAFTLDTSSSNSYGLNWNNGKGSYGTATYKYLDSTSSELAGVYSYMQDRGYTVHTIGNIDGIVKLSTFSILNYGNYYDSPELGLAWGIYVQGQAFQSLSYTIIDHLVLDYGYEHWLNCTQNLNSTMVHEMCGNWDHESIVENYSWVVGQGVEQFNERFFVFGYYEQGTDGSNNIYLGDGLRLTLNAHIAAVPEPVSILFISAGLGLLMKRRLRR